VLLHQLGFAAFEDHMKIVQQTIASLGSPMWIEPLGMPYRSAAVIARWRHLNGRLQIATADAIRVCLSLSTGQQVRHAERDRSLSSSSLPFWMPLCKRGRSA
jgi:hypothetical protein